MPFEKGKSGNPATQFKPGESGNPAGKPKGTVHISTRIRELLDDPTFEQKMRDGTIQQGEPAVAIIKTAIAKAISGDKDAREWLAKYGYGTKVKVETEGEITHKWEELDDDQLDAAIAERQNRITRAAS